MSSSAMSKSASALPPGVRRHKFTRTRDFGTIAKSALDAGGSLQFTLDQVPGYAELTALYDAYSIDSVDVTFVWYQAFTGPGVAFAQSPVMIVTRDYDDANAPATFADVGEYSDATLHPFSVANNKFTVNVKPRVAKQLYRAGVSSGFSWGGQSEIVDAGTVDVPHYGLKWFTDFYSTTYTPDMNIRVFIKYHITGYAAR